MIFGEDDDAWLHGDHGQHDVGRVDRRPHEGDVGGGVQQPGAGVGEIEGTKSDLDGGVGSLEASQEGGGQFAAGRDVQPDPHGAGGRKASDRRHRSLRGPQDGACAVEEHRTGRRQGHAPGGPLEQGDAEDLLELADLGAECLLGHVHPPGCDSEARILGNGYEVPQVTQLDIHSSTVHSWRVFDAAWVSVVPRAPIRYHHGIVMG
jgi:hypothetical protein